MITCATEDYKRGKFVRCGKPATHAEEDLFDSNIEYPMCDDCARISRIHGFISREVGPDEKWEKHYNPDIRDEELENGA